MNPEEFFEAIKHAYKTLKFIAVSERINFVLLRLEGGRETEVIPEHAVQWPKGVTQWPPLDVEWREAMLNDVGKPASVGVGGSETVRLGVLSKTTEGNRGLEFEVTLSSGMVCSGPIIVKVPVVSTLLELSSQIRHWKEAEYFASRQRTRLDVMENLLLNINSGK